eukprot:1844761-Pleurochrysis_carterae.AAC.1
MHALKVVFQNGRRFKECLNESREFCRLLTKLVFMRGVYILLFVLDDQGGAGGGRCECVWGRGRREGRENGNERGNGRANDGEEESEGQRGWRKVATRPTGIERGADRRRKRDRQSRSVDES